MGTLKVIPKEIQDQVLSRIKNDGVTVAQAARDAGISDNTVYGWVAKTANGVNNEAIENARLKRELAGVLLGKLTAELALYKKRTDIGIELCR